MRQIQFLVLSLCSAGLLAGCATSDTPDNDAAGSPPPVKCQGDMVQTGSMIASHNCNQDRNLVILDRDPDNRIAPPQQAVRLR